MNFTMFQMNKAFNFSVFPDIIVRLWQTPGLPIRKTR